MILLDPKHHDRKYADERSREVMRKTIAFFEQKGKRRLKEDDRERVWYADFLEFVEERTDLRDPAHARRPGRPRLPLGYLAQLRVRRDPRLLRPRLLVHLAGLGARARADLDEPQPRRSSSARRACSKRAGSSRSASPSAPTAPTSTRPRCSWCRRPTAATGRAARSTTSATPTRRRSSPTFGKIAGTQDYVFFAIDSQHAKFECIRNVVNSQSYVSNFALHDAPISEADILSRGKEAWNAALNTVNIGKYNLGWASIGICTHALYEALHHAAHRSLYGRAVTEFPHVQAALHRRHRAAGRDEAGGAARCRLPPLRLARGPSLPALQPGREDEGHHPGRGRDRPPLGRDRRQGLRARRLLRDGGPRHPGASQAGGNRTRQHRADREVHAELLLPPAGLSRRSPAATIPRTTTSCSTRAPPGASGRSASTTTRPSSRRARSRTSASSASRSPSSRSCSRRRPRARARPTTSTS